GGGRASQRLAPHGWGRGELGGGEGGEARRAGACRGAGGQGSGAGESRASSPWGTAKAGVRYTSPRGPFPKWSSPESPRPPTPDLRPHGNLPRSARHADRPPRVRRARTPAGAVAGRLLAGRATRRVRRPDLLHESAQSGEPQHGGVPREYQEAGTRLRARARGLRPPGRGDLALLLARAGAAPCRLRLLAAVATLRGRVAR